MSEAMTNGPRDPMNERLTFTVDEVRSCSASPGRERTTRSPATDPVVQHRPASDIV
jgi:hypothetical protein